MATYAAASAAISHNAPVTVGPSAPRLRLNRTTIKRASGRLGHGEMPEPEAQGPRNDVLWSGVLGHGEVMTASRFDREPGLAAVFEAGRSQGALEERERWRKVTGVDSPEQFERRQAAEEADRELHDARDLDEALASRVRFPVRRIEHDGKMRLVRGYSNGRYGYLREDGVFVDLDPPSE
jgi:hypothetical protein